MLKAAMGSGAAEVDEVAAEVIVDTDMVVEEIALVVEMLAVVEVSAVALVVERTEVVSVEVEDSSVDVALVVVSVEEALAVDVVSPLVDDVGTEEAELAEDVMANDQGHDALINQYDYQRTAMSVVTFSVPYDASKPCIV